MQDKTNNNATRKAKNETRKKNTNQKENWGKFTYTGNYVRKILRIQE
jgi:hypothetical protein